MEKIIITEMSSDFSGVGYTPSGKKLNFNYVYKGDEINCELVKRRPKQRSFKIIETIRNHSWDSVQCEHYGRCGGCVGQHIDYEEQIHLKFDPIIRSFKDDLGIELETKPSDSIYSYRTRMDFAVFPGPKIGLRERGNFRKIISISDCKIQSETANKSLSKVISLLNSIPEIIWDRKSEIGGLKYVTIRKAQNTDDGILIFTFTEGFESEQLHQTFVQYCLKLETDLSIVFCYNRKKSEVSSEGRLLLIKGKPTYSEIVMGKQFEIPFDSFFQPNPNGFLPVLNFIEKHRSKQNQSFVDFFCGNGFFSLVFGGNYKSNYGYEVTESAVKMASSLFQSMYPDKEFLFQVTNLFTSVANLSTPLDSCLILDPPRAGAGILLSEWIRDFGPNEVFYVSCNPYSQQEDVKIFIQNYVCKGGLLLDPYPHTPHTESVLYFQRKSN
ncbi:class I SAM-dependent RNA methyltransferase [Leptospira sp. 96542]|nr:class I SAM-dependent RNA methyltransferase [Leptospira sp. 96542]